jgi:hypothetical protein
MFVAFYTILKQRLQIFWSSTPTNFSYEPPLALSKLKVTNYSLMAKRRHEKSAISNVSQVDCSEKEGEPSCT